MLFRLIKPNYKYLRNSAKIYYKICIETYTRLKGVNKQESGSWKVHKQEDLNPDTQHLHKGQARQCDSVISKLWRPYGQIPGTS